MVAIDLYFGRRIDTQRSVTNAEWSAFARQDITPRFPEGFTVVETNGQWLGSRTKMIIEERGMLVRIVADENTNLAARVKSLADAYKSRFGQDSVGIVTNGVCGVF